jgi:hypothetical protein
MRQLRLSRLYRQLQGDVDKRIKAGHIERQILESEKLDILLLTLHNVVTLH